MVSDDIQQIKTIYDNINKKNDAEYENRIEEIYNKHNDLKNIREKLIQKKIDLVKTKILKDNSLIKKSEQELNDVLKQYNKVLKDNNIKESDLERHYDCETCKDTGFINGKKCHCYIDKEIDLYNKISDYDYYKDSLNKFNLDVYKQNLQSVEAKPYFEYMVNKFSEINEMILDNAKINKPMNIFIIGNTGTGKTFLSRYIEKNLINNKKTVIYITVNDLLNAVFKEFNNDDNDENPLFEYINDCDMLILDDLGKENVTEFSTRYIYNLIDNRLSHKKSTIVCSQLNFKEITSIYEESLTTRFYNYFTPIRLEGDDLRAIA